MDSQVAAMRKLHTMDVIPATSIFLNERRRKVNLSIRDLKDGSNAPIQITAQGPDSLCELSFTRLEVLKLRELLNAAFGG